MWKKTSVGGERGGIVVGKAELIWSGWEGQLKEGKGPKEKVRGEPGYRGEGKSSPDRLYLPSWTKKGTEVKYGIMKRGKGRLWGGDLWKKGTARADRTSPEKKKRTEPEKKGGA